jgi:hypothetical protein
MKALSSGIKFYIHSDNSYIYYVDDVIDAINEDMCWITDCYGYVKLCSAITFAHLIDEGYADNVPSNKTTSNPGSVTNFIVKDPNDTRWYGRPKLTPGMNVYSTGEKHGYDSGGSHIMLFLYEENGIYYFSDQGEYNKAYKFSTTTDRPGFVNVNPNARDANRWYWGTFTGYLN